MFPTPFLFALLFRSLSLLFPQTFFQPDEFYQAFEPAHRLVFGYGYLTWEWRDISFVSSGSWWDEIIAGGRLRSWLWPGVFALVFKALELLKLDNTFLLTFDPRVIGVIVAALTDYATYRLSAKLLGKGSSAGALFLSLTSLFHAHLLPRALSTSPETLLVTLALSYFPFPALLIPRDIIVGQKGMVASSSMKDLSKATESQLADGYDTQVSDTIVFDDIAEIDYTVMDRMDLKLQKESHGDSLALAVALATLAICIRPTSVPLWLYLGGDLVWRRFRSGGTVAAISTMLTALWVSLLVVGLSASIDYAITGRVSIPILTFFHQNLIRNISSFYGSTNPFYHLTQSLPIMLFPIWWWWAQGFAASTFPSRFLPPRLNLHQPPGMEVLAKALLFEVFTLSFSPHSEWRFVHPLLPALLLFALAPLNRDFTPTILGCYRLTQSIRQYTRLSKFPFSLCLCAPILPWIYLNAFHGRAQVQVMDILRSGQAGNVTGLVALMPCHSTPWMSHLHKDIPSWFLTCEPPLGDAEFDHTTQQDMFYTSPVSYLHTVFPYPPSPLHLIPDTHASAELPSHVILFGSLLNVSEALSTDHVVKVTVRETLAELGYSEVWSGWNGFDWAQDEPQRRGGVRLWRMK